ncbi:tyrosine-type recombinase/integrase [Alicyclobacillus hesperidum]|uniref:tyrosine-type recombinase/integrase n=1 Tax=Alicyclobacillus hesperidum TaxID=89784 RepID=UPI003B42FF65
MRQDAQKYARKAGVQNVRVSPHTFRHYFATKFLRNGGDPIALQRILGHRDMHMVSIYVNYTKSDIREQHEKFSPVASLGRAVKPRNKGKVKLK